MKKVWFTSDLHLGHTNIIKYNRPKFHNVHEMHYEIVQKWNSTIGMNDIVWVLGDVLYGKQSYLALPLLDQLNGTKNLVLGNHDNHLLNELQYYFNKIEIAYRFDGFVLTHIPVHTQQLSERYKGNIHGHLHNESLSDKRYINVNMDVRDLYPVSLKQVQKEFNAV